MKLLKAFVILAVISTAAYIICQQIWKKPASDKVSITFLGENSSTIKAMMALSAAAGSSDSNINVIYKPNTFDDALNKSNQDFANKTGLYDIVVQYNFTLSSSVRNHYVYDIGDLTKNIPSQKKQFEKDIYPDLWKEVGYYYDNAGKPLDGEKMVSYPYVGISMVLMYNKKLFDDSVNIREYRERYGKDLVPPDNWRDYYNIAKFFTNSTKHTFGVCMEGAPHGLLTAEWTNFLYSFGGKYLDKSVGWYGDANTKVLVNSDSAVNALNYYLSLKPFNYGNFSDVDQVEQMRLMKDGNTAMGIVWTDMLYEILKTPSGFDTTFGFTSIPGNKSMVSGGAYFVNRQSKHPVEAAKFIIDQLQPNTQVKLARLGLCSPLQSVYKDEQVQKLPYSKALQVSLQRGGIRLEAGPDADVISDIMTNYIQKAWAGEINASQAMNGAQAEIINKRSEIFKNISKQ